MSEGGIAWGLRGDAGLPAVGGAGGAGLLVSLAVGVAAGLLPAWHAARTRLVAALR